MLNILNKYRYFILTIFLAIIGIGITFYHNIGLIIDCGGLAPEYKNTDNGATEEEEQFIKVGVIQEVGPECKWCKPDDTIFYTKPSAVPVPFYKQGLQLVCENRVLAVVNEGLTERFNKSK